jgi:penicillin amidase
VFEDEVGEKLFPLLERQRSRTRPLLPVMTDESQGKWCDDVRTPAVETCAQMLDRALEDTVDDLTRRYGEDMSAWKWGDAHVSVSEHRPFSRQALLAKVFEVRVPTGGGTHTVNVGRSNPWDPKEPFASHHGPSLRAIYDLGDASKSRFIHSTGQSGHVLSPNYRDLAERWARVEYLPMVMDRAAIEKDAYATLTLKPGAR